MRPLLGTSVVMVALLVAGACTDSDSADPSTSPTTAQRPDPVERPEGGSVRVGVWSEPDPEMATFGGAAVRALTRPALFVAQPDGSWRPLVVAPGSVDVAPGGGSVSFRIRRGAHWSDGTPITADDLRRSADGRFVAGIDGPRPDGTITVRFTQPLRGWKRLWSGDDAIPPPAADVHGGPFVVAGRTEGLETVLRPNEGWWGSDVVGGPFLDEVRLVLTPDAVIAGQLLERGELDVLAPLAATHNGPWLDGLDGYDNGAAAESGWWFGLLLNHDRVAAAERAAVAATVPRQDFVRTLLAGEAHVLDGFGPPELYGEGAGPWADVDAGHPAGLAGEEIDLIAYREVPMSPLLQRSIQRRARDVGGTFELRNAEAEIVAGWLAERAYGTALVLERDDPWPCWSCRWGHVAPELAARADGGDLEAVGALQRFLRDEVVALPIWRPVHRVAWRDDLGGVSPNGYADSPAWNAWEWWVEG